MTLPIQKRCRRPENLAFKSRSLPPTPLLPPTTLASSQMMNSKHWSVFQNRGLRPRNQACRQLHSLLLILPLRRSRRSSLPSPRDGVADFPVACAFSSYAPSQADAGVFAALECELQLFLLFPFHLALLLTFYHPLALSRPLCLGVPSRRTMVLPHQDLGV